MRPLTFGLFAFLLLTSHSFAQQGNIMVWGVGQHSCGKFLENLKENPKNETPYGQWLQGYITGRNHASSEISDFAGGIDRPALIAWISNYCKERPLDSFYDATNRLLQTLEKTGRVRKQQ